MKWHSHSKTLSLTAKVVTPISIALVAIFFGGLYAFDRQEASNFEQFIVKQRAIFNSELEAKLWSKESILRGMHGVISEDTRLISAFQEQNKPLLYERAKEYFNTVSAELAISHFYFTNTDKVNFLRVHAYERDGDTISRLSTALAVQNGEISTGLELGPLGTLTLRSVSPWLDEQNTIYGFVELGIDMESILSELALQNDIGVLLAIYKDLLDQDLWTEGNEVFGHSASWGQYQDVVISKENWLSNEQLNNLPNLNAVQSDTNNEISLKNIKTVGDRSHYWVQLPIHDLNNEPVGKIYVALDVSEWLELNTLNEKGVLTVYIVLSIGLIAIIYSNTRRADVAEFRLNKTVDQLEQLASYDQLTGLPNRSLFIEELETRLIESKRFSQSIAVAFIDLDNFKVINDTEGHRAGDQLLIEVTRRLETVLRDYDIFARFGGDEFILMLPHANRDQAVNIANKLLATTLSPFLLGKQEYAISMSMGISMYPEDGDHYETLLRNADMAMYKAKGEGKNCFRFFSAEMNKELEQQQTIEKKLRKAIRDEEFSLFYQPQYDLYSKAIVGVEALIRWFPAKDTQILPVDFIPIAEKSKLINAIGDWVITESCRQAAVWRSLGLELHIDINISGQQLNTHDVFNSLETNISKHGLTYSDIGIELTENVLIESNSKSMVALQKMSEMGMSIAVDDFGTGYSSLNYLKEFPVTKVKIDKTFIQDAPTDNNDRAIIEAITAMSHSLGLEVIVEGVETLEQERISRELNCDIVQGYYYSKPVSASDILNLARQASLD